MLVTTGLSIDLQQIRLQTLVVIDSKSCQTLFPSFCVPPFKVAVLFYQNPSRLPFLGQFISAALKD